jgi:hypothetical protein
MTITLDQVQPLVDQLTPGEKARLIEHLTAQLTKEAILPEPPESQLGRQLRSLRAAIVASGVPLLDRHQLAAEVTERRGE